MGQFDAGTILDDLLNARESYFLLREELDGHTEIIDACGAPAIYHSLDEATEIARKYLAERPDEDLEIRVRRISISPVTRIITEENPRAFSRIYTLWDKLWKSNSSIDGPFTKRLRKSSRYS